MASRRTLQWGSRWLPGPAHRTIQQPHSVFLLAKPIYPNTRQTRSIRSILKPAPKRNRFDTSLGLAPTALQVAAPLQRRERTTPIRTGLLAVKKGMSSVYDTTTGIRTPVTVLQLDRCQVLGHKTRAQHGYWAVQIGHGWRDWRNCTRADLGVFRQRGVAPKQRIVEFRVRDESGLVPVGAVMTPAWFREGQLVDVRGTTKGKGFAGGMKRHGWAGQPASHGQSLTHRTMGSAGGSQGSGSRVIPGKKMPGRMGGNYHTVQNLEVMRVDEENGLIVVKGHVSGPNKSIVQIWDAKKRPEQREKLDLPMVPLSLLAAGDGSSAATKTASGSA